MVRALHPPSGNQAHVFGDVFPPLPTSLFEDPEWPKQRPKFGEPEGRTREIPGLPRRREGDSNTGPARAESADENAPIASNTPANAIRGVATLEPSQPKTIPSEPVCDAVEAALANALGGAAAASEWATVARLAEELQARRLARAGVVALRPLPPVASSKRTAQ